MVKKIITLPTDDSKIYRQILAFLNFSLEATPQERDVLAEIIQLNNEYEALPAKQRAKFILSTDMRKETRERLDIEEKQFNTILSRLRKKVIFGSPVFDDDGILNKVLEFRPDSEGLKIEINLVNVVAKTVTSEVKKEIHEEFTAPVEEPIINIPEPIVEKKLASPANGTENIIEEGELPSGFIILQPHEK
jgi:hypothetical protein